MRASEPKPARHHQSREIQRGLPARRREGSGEPVPADPPAEHRDGAAGSRAGGGRSALRPALPARSPAYLPPCRFGIRRCRMDGGREQIERPRVRHETDGKVRLGTYEAPGTRSIRSWHRLRRDFPSGLWSGSPARRSSRSAASRMWAEMSREWLAMLRSRPLSQADWLAVLIDGIWLTREICVIVAVGIDPTGRKQVLDFELGPSECVTAMTALLKSLAARVGGGGQGSGNCWWAGMAVRPSKLRCGGCGHKRFSRSALCTHSPTCATGGPGGPRQSFQNAAGSKG